MDVGVVIHARIHVPEISSHAMKNHKFGDINLIIADSDSMVRQGLKTAFFDHGFRNTRDTSRMSVVGDAVDNDAVDLIIAENELQDGKISDLTRHIRHHEAGDNPFLVVITLMEEPTSEAIMEVIDSGTDDLLIKPISPALLIERVNILTRKRKRFVVTTDYVGPTRRAAPRPGSQEIPEFRVPNPLRLKATGKYDAETLKREIDEIAHTINEQKKERHAYQIDYLVDNILPLYGDGGADEGVIEHLERLLFVSEDISRRLSGTDDAHVGELCQSMTDVVNRILEAPLSPDDKDLRLLPELSRAIKNSFDAEAAHDISHDISEALKEAQRRTDTKGH